MPDLMYRIYVEDVIIRRDKIEAILYHYVDGYSIFYGDGAYKGNRERCLVVEVFGTTLDIIKVVAEKIREACNHDSVIIASFPYTLTFVNRPTGQIDSEVLNATTI